MMGHHHVTVEDIEAALAPFRAWEEEDELGAASVLAAHRALDLLAGLAGIVKTFGECSACLLGFGDVGELLDRLNVALANAPTRRSP